MVPNNMPEGMLSRRIAVDGTAHLLAVGRDADHPFGPRDKALLALFHDELARHVGQTLTTSVHPVARLTPRLREVLVALLGGDSEKLVARRLGIATTTTHDHVKSLYRHFGVASRPELMAYFLRRGWKLPTTA